MFTQNREENLLSATKGRPRCARCLAPKAASSAGGPLCGPCRRIYNRVYVETLPRVKLLYSDPATYIGRVRDSEGAGVEREYVGDVAASGPPPERPAATKEVPDAHLRRMERRILLYILADLALKPREREDVLRLAPGGDELRGVVGGENSRKVYSGSPRTLALVWPRPGYDLHFLEDRFGGLVDGGAVRCLASLREIPMDRSAGGDIALWRVLGVEEHSRLVAPPPAKRNGAPGEVFSVSGMLGTERRDGRMRIVGPPARERDVSWLSDLSEEEILSLSAAVGAEMKQRSLGWNYERHTLGRGWLQKDPRKGTSRGYWVFRWIEDGKRKHEYIGDDDALAVWKRRHPEGL